MAIYIYCDRSVSKLICQCISVVKERNIPVGKSTGEELQSE